MEEACRPNSASLRTAAHWGHQQDMEPALGCFYPLWALAAAARSYVPAAMEHIAHCSRESRTGWSWSALTQHSFVIHSEILVFNASLTCALFDVYLPS